MSADKFSGGHVEAPGTSCDAAFVMTKEGAWRLRWLVKPEDVQEWGGCALLGTGQMVPLDSVAIPEPRR